MKLLIMQLINIIIIMKNISIISKYISNTLIQYIKKVLIYISNISKSISI